jgi:hypothetical protein
MEIEQAGIFPLEIYVSPDTFISEYIKTIKKYINKKTKNKYELMRDVAFQTTDFNTSNEFLYFMNKKIK